MRSTQSIIDLHGSLVRLFLTYSRSINRLYMCNGQNTLLYRGIWRQNQIVLVLPEGALSFFGKHTNYLHGYTLKPYGLSNGIVSIASKKIGYHRFSKQTNFGT